MKDVKIPAVGESITEATVARWIKKTGEFVKKGEAILEVETDKANVEVVAEDSGILKTSANEGDVVAIGATVAQIDESKSAPAGAATPAPEKTTSAPTAPASASAATEMHASTELSPAVRKIVAEKGMDPASLQGTGKDGRLTKSDVTNPQTKAPAEPAKAPAAPLPTRAPSSQQASQERVKMTNIRKRIAERLLMSQQSTATLTTFNDVDMTNLLALRAKYKDSFKEKYGVSLGFMGFFVKASIEALKEIRAVNGFIDGQEMVYNNFYNIGIAVGTERGLMVPVLRDADQLSMAGVEQEIKRYAAKARDGKITPDDLSGGTFTISNGGVYGSLMSTPILNPPQSGILGMHRIEERPVAINGKVEIRPMMYLALSYDHRVIDGTESVKFLVKLKQCIEDPSRILLEV
jgi:2-oxoglutarate dehydrogenase E2 component (dihydrolipoamide succinyltransferase)